MSEHLRFWLGLRSSMRVRIQVRRSRSQRQSGCSCASRTRAISLPRPIASELPQRSAPKRRHSSCAALWRQSNHSSVRRRSIRSSGRSPKPRSFPECDESKRDKSSWEAILWPPEMLYAAGRSSGVDTIPRYRRRRLAENRGLPDPPLSALCGRTGSNFTPPLLPRKPCASRPGPRSELPAPRGPPATGCG